MTDYRGMRWFKCDLQVQTPEDSRHWQDDAIRLNEPRRPMVDGRADESDIQEKARHFLRCCHKLGLEMIGVTEHNFSSRAEPRDWFLTHLVEQNKSVARDLGKSPLVILPGFEVDIGYHVLCLFAPAKKLRHLRRTSMVLSKLGLPENERFRKGVPQPLRVNNRDVSLKDLLEIVQNQHHGIVIAAHADQKDGILSNARFVNDYGLLGLMCVELTQNPPAPKYANILAGQDAAWSRKNRHPAWLMSSDAKSLAAGDDGLPAPNSLGYRYTWIKMSEPSIKALRQAFLDHESRLCSPEDISKDQNPAESERHPRIVSLRIMHAEFAEDQAIAFSPNLNCVIGGRGSGKSTLLEYLRFAFGKDRHIEDDSTQEKVERIHRTLCVPKASVEVVWQTQAGVKDRLRYTPEGGVEITEDAEVIHLDTYLAKAPVVFLSQQELTRKTEGKKNLLLPLLDAYARASLQSLDAEARGLRAEIESLFGLRRQKQTVDEEARRLSQELSELNRDWRARASLQDAAKVYQYSQDAQRYLDRVKESVQEPSRLLELAQDFVESHSPVGSAAERWSHPDWFKTLDSGVEEVKEEFLRAIRAAVAGYRQAIGNLIDKDSAWPEVSRTLADAKKGFENACAQQGLQPKEVAQLQEVDRQRKAKQLELERKQARSQALAQDLARLPRKRAELHRVWRRQYRQRLEAVERANRMGINLRQKFIEVKVDYAGDRDAFMAAWNRLAPDGRTQLGRRWPELGDCLMALFVRTAVASPWRLLERYLIKPERAPEDIARMIPDLRSHLDKPESARLWEQAQLMRVPDLVDVILYRADGVPAGSVREGKLSDGQRNTAALALILAQGDGPLVIDQPEDELDSNFIYRDLVPLLREIKRHRQLIFATHNANLPVNGDAELVYALEASAGRGRPLAHGGLDRDEVTKAVLEIMEGSDEAFRRRSEKYHF